MKLLRRALSHFCPSIFCEKKILKTLLALALFWGFAFAHAQNNLIYKFISIGIVQSADDKASIAVDVGLFEERLQGRDVYPLLKPAILEWMASNSNGYDIGLLQQALTRLLRQQGYLIAQAVITESDVEIFKVKRYLRVNIYLGRIGGFVIENTSRVKTPELEALVKSALCPDGLLSANDCVLEASRLERTTQLLQSVPGVVMSGAPTLDSEDVGFGQTRIVFKVSSNGKPYKIDVSLDNQGAQATGVMRYGLVSSGDNIFGIGDSWNASINTTSANLWGGALGFSAPVGDDGFRWTTGLSRVNYTIFQSGLIVEGAANTASLGLAYPIVRGLDLNVNASLDLLGTETTLSYQGFGTADYSNLTYARAAISANSGDRATQLGMSYWSGGISYTRGNQNNNNPNDAYSAQRAGVYDKWAGALLRKQNLTQDGAVFALANLRGQMVNKNIDFSEMMQVGGISAVRAYLPDEGMISQGVVVQTDLKKRFSLPDSYGQLAPGVLMDFASGMVNRQTWPGWQQGYPTVPNVTNNRVLAGYGASLDWVMPGGFTTTLTWARKFAFSEQSWVQPGSADSRLWFSFSWKQ